MLIIAASVISASTAVLNRNLKSVDYSVIMTYHGMLGFSASLVLLLVQFFVRDDVSEGEPGAMLKTLDLTLFGGAILAFSVTVDALSVFS